MRATVTRARDAGTNLAFFGANTMYWRIRLDDRTTGPARLVVGYRSDAHLDPVREERPLEATARFRDAPAAAPEQDLIGMQYECYPVDTDFVIASAGWWGFEGTGVANGDHVNGLVGPEADRVYPGRLTPRPIQVVAHTAYDCRGVTTTSQSVYYTTPSGAAVFAAGTLRWGCALLDRCERPLGARTGRFVSVVTGNLLTEFATGPVGRHRPARDNLDRFQLPLGQHGRRELSPGGRSDIMAGMTRGRGGRGGRVRHGAAVLVALGRDPLGLHRRRRAGRTATRATPAMALNIESAPGAGSLGEKAQADAETDVGDVLSHYLVEGFLGDYPREDFVGAFDAFTGGAASSAARQLDLLTANRYRDASDVQATRLDARLSFLVDGRDVVGASAAVRFAFEATGADGDTSAFTLEGRILLDEVDGTWSVFGYDLVRDDPGQVDAEATS